MMGMEGVFGLVYSKFVHMDSLFLFYVCFVVRLATLLMSMFVVDQMASVTNPCTIHPTPISSDDDDDDRKEGVEDPRTKATNRAAQVKEYKKAIAKLKERFPSQDTLDTFRTGVQAFFKYLEDRDYFKNTENPLLSEDELPRPINELIEDELDNISVELGF